jgi:fatty-acyl-CoA synthase
VNLPLLVSEFIDRARSLYGSELAVTCGSVQLTYRALAERVDRLSGGLLGLGVKRGEVVAYVSFNCHRLLEGYYAVPQIGAVLLPINIRLTPHEIEYILADASASVVIVDRALTPLIAPIRSRLRGLRCVVLMGDASVDPELDGVDYEEMVSNAPPSFDRPELKESDTAELFYTSGTTAQPKGVMLTQRQLYLHALHALLSIRCDDTTVLLHSIPLFHVNGWGAPHFITVVGGRHVMLARFDPAQVLATIERERVTLAFFVPTMAHALAADPSWATRDLRSLQRVMLGGAAASPSLVRTLDERLPDCIVTCGYGLSETSPVLTVANVKRGGATSTDASREVRGTAGLPIPGAKIGLMDDEGALLPHDGVSSGEIVVRSNWVMDGYWGQPAATAAAMARGWFHTGDVGTIDADGYVRIVDRKKDIIITGGENVPSIEIEKAIYEHPAVAECAVIAAPDERWGEVPLAIVVRKADARADESEIIEHCKRTLAAFKVPRRVVFADAPLPKGGTGKILKRELRAKYL